jgi:hypothetical protein
VIDHRRGEPADNVPDTDGGGNMGEPPVEPTLAEVVEEITRRLESGDAVNAEEHIRRNPTHAGRIQRLLPVLQTMISLGRIVAPR